MTKKNITDLLAYFILISVSKEGGKVIDKHITPEQVDKMMRAYVSLFSEDEKIAEKFIINELEKLLKKLDEYEVTESQRKSFIKGEGLNG